MTKKQRTHGDILVGDPRKIVTEDNKRSDHNDFATTTELRERMYCGLRYNVILQVVEIWLDGKQVKAIPAPNNEPNPHELDRAYREVFGISLSELSSLR